MLILYHDLAVINLFFIRTFFLLNKTNLLINIILFLLEQEH